MGFIKDTQFGICSVASNTAAIFQTSLAMQMVELSTSPCFDCSQASTKAAGHNVMFDESASASKLLSTDINCLCTDRLTALYLCLNRLQTALQHLDIVDRVRKVHQDPESLMHSRLQSWDWCPTDCCRHWWGLRCVIKSPHKRLCLIRCSSRVNISWDSSWCNGWVNVELWQQSVHLFQGDCSSHQQHESWWLPGGACTTSPVGTFAWRHVAVV